MSPQDPQSELRGLVALTDVLRQRVLAELEALQRGGTVTPLLRSCLTRARGHMELAQRALGETRAGQDPLSLPQASIPLTTAGVEFERRATGRHAFHPSGEESAPSWVESRAQEIGRALESALGDGFGAFGEETAQPIGRPKPQRVVKVVQSSALESLDSALFENIPEPEVGAACPAPQAPPHFSGNTDVLSIPDLVGFFQVQAKTGVLDIEHSSESFRLEFENGSLMHAASTNSPKGERLGEILVRRGALTEAQLQAFLANLARGERLGNALLRADGISEAELTKAIEEQVLGIFVRLAKLPGCRFEFRECKLEANSAGRVRHNITRLLLDSARHLDEARQKRASA